MFPPQSGQMEIFGRSGLKKLKCFHDGPIRRNDLGERATWSQLCIGCDNEAENAEDTECKLR